MLHVDGSHILDSNGKDVRLRGVGIGGYLHLENFINGYPGTGHELQEVMANDGFFRKMLDCFFTEEDVKFIKDTGANTIRLPLNYRWFESSEGYERIDDVVDWCETHDVYVVLDAHAVPGWQNTDWSCDNATGRALFWKEQHYQDRFVSWWESLAERYRGKSAVAGYDLLNEPVSNAPPTGGFDKASYEPNWSAVNQLYRRTVNAIRAIDPDHIIFIEGDGYSERFSGLDEPFADNLVYSSHHYSNAGFGPGAYPTGDWNVETQRQHFLESEAVRFAKRHGVPLWVGEFGAVYNGPDEEVSDRLRAIEDQLEVYESEGVHWTMWTYKDCGVLGWVTLDPGSPYMEITAAVRKAKIELDTDFWLHWLPDPPFRRERDALAMAMLDTIATSSVSPAPHRAHVSLALSNYAGALLQPVYAALFRDAADEELDEVLASFQLSQCVPNWRLLQVVRRACRSETE